jgi:hypothetical protein
MSNMKDEKTVGSHDKDAQRHKDQKPGAERAGAGDDQRQQSTAQPGSKGGAQPGGQSHEQGGQHQGGQQGGQHTGGQQGGTAGGKDAGSRPGKT